MEGTTALSLRHCTAPYGTAAAYSTISRVRTRATLLHAGVLVGRSGQPGERSRYVREFTGHARIVNLRHGRNGTVVPQETRGPPRDNSRYAAAPSSLPLSSSALCINNPLETVPCTRSARIFSTPPSPLPVSFQLSCQLAFGLCRISRRT